ILDAPGLKNDFYLNLVDWSNKDILSMALSTFVYYVNMTDYHGKDQEDQIKVLCADTDHTNFVSSLKSNESGELLAVGTKKGWKAWDVQAQTVVSGWKLGAYRCLAWNGNMLAAGSLG
ncbi:hypothetical protein PRIPAC_87571, partial [Pristionchus pacificus]|uniref:Uncharacterized protein n=1 Tax=Pristionchus pacificus TaxID=54126 RepID=A0A2A6B5L7_PRIPA